MRKRPAHRAGLLDSASYGSRYSKRRRARFATSASASTGLNTMSIQATTVNG
jgi:hypothetical protein